MNISIHGFLFLGGKGMALPELGAGLGAKLAMGLAGLTGKAIIDTATGTVELGKKPVDFDLELGYIANEEPEIHGSVEIWLSM